jgi:hypothetical protein
MIRAVKVSPPLARARHPMEAKWQVSQVPRTWTRMTRSKSAGVMFHRARSRTMPALLTKMSSWP